MTANDNRFYEGCGREGPVRCIFLSEFHMTAGPKIVCQVPDNYISKDTFESVSVYIIPKNQLQRSMLTVTVLGFKIIGFPVRIEGPKYTRNAYYFNLCFVFDAWARTVQYESVVRKLSDYLVAMEVESSFLYQPQDMNGENVRLTRMLLQVMQDLNSHKMCTLTEGTMTTHLKVVRILQDPPLVLDHHVPIFMESPELFQAEQWDLTTQKVLPFIDGFNHVAKIAAEADVENNLVKACLQNLVYYGVVSMIHIFQYSNVYATTPKLRRLAEDRRLQEECIKHVARYPRQPPTVRDVFRMFCSMTRGTTVRDICIRLSPHTLRINERKLVQFGLLEGFIHRIHKFPVGNVEKPDPQSTAPQSFSGLLSMDEYCCQYSLPSQKLEELIDREPNIVVIWK